MNENEDRFIDIMTADEVDDAVCESAAFRSLLELLKNRGDSVMIFRNHTGEGLHFKVVTSNFGSDPVVSDGADLSEIIMDLAFDMNYSDYLEGE